MSTDAAGRLRIISTQSPCKMLSSGRSAGSTFGVRRFVAGALTRSITPMFRPCLRLKEGPDESGGNRRPAQESRDYASPTGYRDENERSLPQHMDSAATRKGRQSRVEGRSE